MKLRLIHKSATEPNYCRVVDADNETIFALTRHTNYGEQIVEAYNNYASLKANADALRNFVEYYLDRDCSVEDCDKVARALLAKLDKERE